MGRLAVETVGMNHEIDWEDTLELYKQEIRPLPKYNPTDGDRALRAGLARRLSQSLRDELDLREISYINNPAEWFMGPSRLNPYTCFIKDRETISELIAETDQILDDLYRDTISILVDAVESWDAIRDKIKDLVDPAYEVYNQQRRDAIELVESMTKKHIDDMAAPLISSILPYLNEDESVVMIRRGQLSKANIEGCYAIFGPSGILYIGQTQNIRIRLYAHKKQTLAGLSWLGVICIPSNRRMQLERTLIKELQPPLNRAGVIHESELFWDSPVQVKQCD